MKQNSTLLSLLALLMILVACGEQDNDNVLTLSSDEVADEVAMSVSAEVNGMVTDMLTFSGKASGGRTSGVANVCGITYDTSIMRSYAGQYVTFALELSYGYEVVCSGLIPTALEFGFEADGHTETSRLVADGNTTGDLIATGFTSANYAVNGVLNRTYALSQKTGDKIQYTSTSQATISDLLISKSSGAIVSGMAVYTLSGTGANLGDFTFTAAVTFMGNGTASVVIGDSTYVVTLATGKVEKEG